MLLCCFTWLLLALFPCSLLWCSGGLCCLTTSRLLSLLGLLLLVAFALALVILLLNLRMAITGRRMGSAQSQQLFRTQLSTFLLVSVRVHIVVQLNRLAGPYSHLRTCAC